MNSKIYATLAFWQALTRGVSGHVEYALYVLEVAGGLWLATCTTIITMLDDLQLLFLTTLSLTRHCIHRGTEELTDIQWLPSFARDYGSPLYGLPEFLHPTSHLSSSHSTVEGVHIKI